MVRAAATHKTSDSPPLSNRRGSWTPPTVYAAAEKRRIGVYGTVREQQQQLCGFDAPKRPKRFE